MHRVEFLCREATLPSFGAKLKSEREKRAITLEQISSSTKIGTRMLQALEEENFDKLPGGIFSKGFVRAYARHLGLNEEETISGYLQASGQDDLAQVDMAVTDSTPEEEPGEPSGSWQVPWGLLAVVLLLFALALSLWNRRQQKNEVLSASRAPIHSEKPAANSPGGSHAGSSTSLNLGGDIAPAAAAASAKDMSRAPTPAIASTVLAAAAATPAGEFSVVILARDDSWLSITADGKNVFQDVLLAEDQRAVHGQKEVVIRAGNIGALDFQFNGKKLASQGDYGEVKTLTFGSGGLQPTAPARTVSQ